MSSGPGTPITPAGGEGNSDDVRHKVFEGQMFKFTNVVKGWQYRWFVLTAETGQLEYRLMDEDGIGKSRGVQHLAGTVVVPSEEDGQTFNVNFASGEAYKLRASNRVCYRSLGR